MGFALSKALAQNYPVSGTIQVKPPYSVYLSDYTKIKEDKLVLNLRLNDPTDPVRDVFVRFKLESSTTIVETNPAYRPAPVTLTSGFPERLTGADFYESFLANNLQFTRGISKQEFQRRNAIPEGLYKICAEVYDYGTGTLLSLPICTQVWILLNDPPRLMLPENNSIVKANDPQNLVFRWTPMNTGSPNSFFSTEYEFKLYEIWPANRNPNDAVNTTPAIFETTTSIPNYIYTLSDPYLMPGRSYAWRVKAKDANGMDLFKNQGFSEVFSFTWGVQCDIPINITSEAISSDRTKVLWDEMENATGYMVRFREKGSSGAWYEHKLATTNTILTGTKPEKEYEFQVKCECGGIAGEYSPLKYFTTPKASEYLDKLDCNARYSGDSIKNKEPLLSAQAGDEWTVGLFKVTLTEVTGSNGVFSGKCTVNINLINTEVIAKFTNVKVNTDRQVYQGEMVVVSAGASLLPPEVRDAVKNQLAEIDGYMEDFNKYYNDGKAMVTKANEVWNKVEDIEKQVESYFGKDSSGNSTAKDQFTKFKDQINDGLAAIKSGDTTKGKDLLTGGLNGLKNVLGLGGSLVNAIAGEADKLKELVVKLLTEQRIKDSTTKKQAEADLPGAEEDYAKAVEAVSAQEETTIGSHERVTIFEEIELVNEERDIEVLNEESIQTLMNDTKYKNFMLAVERVVNIALTIQLYEVRLKAVQGLLDTDLDELVKDLRTMLITAGKDAFQAFLDGKDASQVEEQIKTYLEQELKKKIEEELNK